MESRLYKKWSSRGHHSMISPAQMRKQLKKHNYVQEAKYFLKNFKYIFCFQDADFVSSTHAVWGCKRENIWETLKKR